MGGSADADVSRHVRMTLRAQVISPSTLVPLAVCTKESFQLHFTAPLYPNGLALLGERARACSLGGRGVARAAPRAGELGKFVPVSRDRITNLILLDAAILVDVVGGPGEAVSMFFFNVSQQPAAASVVTCAVSGAGSVRIVYPTALCE